MCRRNLSVRGRAFQRHNAWRMVRRLLLALLAFVAGTLIVLPTGARLGVALTFGTFALLAMLLFLMLYPFPASAPDAQERKEEKEKARAPARGRKAKAERRQAGEKSSEA